MYALDSDTATLFFNGNEEVVQRVLAAPDAAIWLPAIVVEEQLKGRMAALASLNAARVSDRLKVPYTYGLLLRTVRELQASRHLPYTADMEALYQSWPAAVKRVETRDCRIAATAIIHGFTVITCNLSHFQPIPDVQMEDWSQP